MTTGSEWFHAFLTVYLSLARYLGNIEPIRQEDVTDDLEEGEDYEKLI